MPQWLIGPKLEHVLILVQSLHITYHIGTSHAPSQSQAIFTSSTLDRFEWGSDKVRHSDNTYTVPERFHDRLKLKVKIMIMNAIINELKSTK